MASSGQSIATAYVQILPSTEGIGGNLANVLGGGAASAAGASIGSVMGGSLGGALASTVGKYLPQIGLAAAAAGVADFGKQSVKTGMDFDRAMSQVYALMIRMNGGVGLTDAQMTTLRERAREMGSTTQYTAQEVADAMSFMALAGWNVEQVYNEIPNVLNLAAASGMEIGRASDIITDYMGAFANTAPTAVHLVDLLALAQASHNATTEQYAQGWKYSAGMMNAFGQSADTTTAILSRLADQGHKGSTGGVELTAVMTALYKSMDKFGNVEIAGQIINLAEATENFNPEEFAAQVEQLNSELEGLDPASDEWAAKVFEFNETLGRAGEFRNIIDVFGDIEAALANTGRETGTIDYIGSLGGVFGNVRAFRGIVTILNGGTDAMRDFETALGEADGTAQHTADVLNDNLKGDLLILNSALDELKIAISDQLTPVVRDFVQAITPVIQWLADRISGRSALGDAAKEVEQLGQEDWEGIGQKIQTAMDTLYNPDATPEDKFEAAQYLQEQMGIIANMDWTGTGADAIAGIMGGMTNYNFSGDAAALLGNMQGAIDREFGINSPATAMIPTGEYAAAGLGQGFQQYDYTADALLAANAMKTAITTTLEIVGWNEPAGKIATGIARGITSNSSRVGNAAASLATVAKSRLSTLIGSNGSKFKPLGENISKGIAEGIKDGSHWVADAVKKIIQEALEKGHAVIEDGSPSRLFARELGKPIAQGVGKGVTDNIFEGEDAVAEMVDRMAGVSAAGLTGDGSLPARGGYVFNQTVNSPKALTPWEVARQARNATRQMAEALA